MGRANHPLRAISGLVPFGGSITYKINDLKKVALIASLHGHRPGSRGTRIFGNLTVQDNHKCNLGRKDRRKLKRFRSVFTIFPRLNEAEPAWRNALRRGAADVGGGSGTDDRGSVSFS